MKKQMVIHPLPMARRWPQSMESRSEKFIIAWVQQTSLHNTSSAVFSFY